MYILVFLFSITTVFVYPATYSPLPFAIPTNGEVGSDEHGFIKEFAIRRVEYSSEFHSGESRHVTEGAEIARPMLLLSFLLCCIFCLSPFGIGFQYFIEISMYKSYRVL